MLQEKFAPSVILVDADYLDSLAFDLIVNFERMIGRRIPKADLCHWLNCIALDGGLRPGENVLQAHFLHSKEKLSLDNFKMTFASKDEEQLTFKDDLNGQNFLDNIGKFSLFAFPVEEVVSKEDFFIQSLAMLAEAKEVESIMVVADMEKYGKDVKNVCAGTRGTDITLFTMEPTTGRGFSQEILGYSLMSALGIRSDEI